MPRSKKNNTGGKTPSGNTGGKTPSVKLEENEGVVPDAVLRAKAGHPQEGHPQGAGEGHPQGAPVQDGSDGLPDGQESVVEDDLIKDEDPGDDFSTDPDEECPQQEADEEGHPQGAPVLDKSAVVRLLASRAFGFGTRKAGFVVGNVMIGVDEEGHAVGGDAPLDSIDLAPGVCEQEWRSIRLNPDLFEVVLRV